MAKIDDGGPAFPVPISIRRTQEQVAPDFHWDEPITCSEGMTLRDWFAGQVLQGDLASQSEVTGEWLTDNAGNLAARCYAFADAMLAERAKER